LKVIDESNKLLVSMYYSTRDLDLLISLGILPNPVNCISRKTSLCAKGILKLIIESKLLGGSICRFGSSIRCLFLGPSIVTRIKACLPCIKITGFVISIHSIVVGNMNTVTWDDKKMELITPEDAKDKD
jgi:hypothetical protein